MNKDERILKKQIRNMRINLLNIEKNTMIMKNGKTLQQRLEDLQEQQRQDYETFQMSVNLDTGYEYEKGFRTRSKKKNLESVIYGK